MLKSIIYSVILFSNISFSKVQPFGESELKVALAKYSKGVIYLVSPNMYLSLKGFNEYKEIASKAKISFIPVLDPLAKSKSNTLKINLDGIPTLSAKSLVLRGATQHYPSFRFLDRKSGF